MRGQVGQREGRQAADPEALVLPGQHVVGQVDFLVDHGELHLGVLTGDHLGGNDDTNEANAATAPPPWCDGLTEHRGSYRL